MIGTTLKCSLSPNSVYNVKPQGAGFMAALTPTSTQM